MVLTIILDCFSSGYCSYSSIAHLALVSSRSDWGKGYFADSAIITAIHITNHAGGWKHWLHSRRRVNTIGIYNI